MSEPSVSVDGLPGVPADYYGRPTRRLATAHCWVEVLAQGGPRVVRFGLHGGENLFAETPTASWDGGHGTYELLGAIACGSRPRATIAASPTRPD